MLRALTVMLALAAACDNPTASRPGFAYNPTTLSNGQLYRWPSGSVLRVWVDPGPAAALDVARSARAAITAWNAEARFGEFRLQSTTDSSQANILVFDRSGALPIRPGSCAFDSRGAVGYTYFCAQNGMAQRLALANGVAAEATVVIRVDRTLTTTQAGLDAIVTHEFGHALGIGAHSSDAGDVMFGLPVVTRPSSRDAQTLQFVLGSPADVLLR